MLTWHCSEYYPPLTQQIINFFLPKAGAHASVTSSNSAAGYVLLPGSPTHPPPTPAPSPFLPRACQRRAKDGLRSATSLLARSRLRGKSPQHTKQHKETKDASRLACSLPFTPSPICFLFHFVFWLFLTRHRNHRSK